MLQRSIEATTHQGWKPKVDNSRRPASTKSMQKGCSIVREGMLREDSAYEMYAGYRNAIKGVSQV